MIPGSVEVPAVQATVEVGTDIKITACNRD